MDNTIRIGTRNSRLAMIQTEMVAASQREAPPGVQVYQEARKNPRAKIF